MAWCLVKHRDNFKFTYLQGHPSEGGAWCVEVREIYELQCWGFSISFSKNFLQVQQDANFEAFTVIMFHVEVFWVVTPCSSTLI